MSKDIFSYNEAIGVTIEEFRAAQYAYVERAKEMDTARNALRNAESAGRDARTRMEDAQSALIRAIADNP